ncbi:phytanoyl-CoA dioxygenase family protein [Fictibacillus sp. KIGAM418]|uniref:Phytanoyl-CoA dioxygenase family protein n=1 Tax=Fictibacillus marinisediminis TaxID=2878389 RepID=A0A9X1XI84_9BACL|nr:phytanoyl-CoA dioxygenase family protein [Fictibacillus marinisediminis]MCK6259425.1 phytanoyl-CoA dioxygenase family protein [Fictibacillus marinisediminis]
MTMTSILDEFKQQGFVVIPNAYTSEEVEKLKEQYQHLWMDQVREGIIQQDPEKPLESLYPRIKDYHQKEENVFHFVMKPEVISLVEHLLEEEVDLISTNFYFKPPGAQGMPMHQDNYGIGVTPGKCIAVWVSLSEAKTENGSMRFVQGTADFDILEPEKTIDEKADTFGGYVQTLKVPEGHEIVHLNTSPGDIVIYNGAVLHDSPPNNTKEEFRQSIISHFAPVSAKKLHLITITL